jgi:hypothetical protein
MKDRVSVLFVGKGNLDVLDGAFVIVDKNGVRTHGGVRSRAANVPRVRGMNRPMAVWMVDHPEMLPAYARQPFLICFASDLS